MMKETVHIWCHMNNNNNNKIESNNKEAIMNF